MIYYELKNRSDGATLVSTLSKCPGHELFTNHADKNIQVGEYKHTYREYPNWIVRLIASKDEELFKSGKIATRTANAYAELAPIVNEMRRSQETAYKIFFHNLVTTHAQLQGETESILPERALMATDSHADQLKVAQNAVRNRPDEAADALLQITKRVVDLQSQIQGFKILTGEATVDFGWHNLRKALFSVLSPFYEKFVQANLTLKIHISEEAAAAKMVHLDYKLFNVALHHFLSNALKYAKPRSYIDISFDPESMILEASMISVKIEPEEMDEIFKLGTPGKHAVAFSGEGIGMYMVKRALEIMNSHMEIVMDPSYPKEIILGVPYTKNRFLIHLPRS